MAKDSNENHFNYSKPDFCKPRTQPLECMILGLSRTGTQSMKEVFRILGYGTIYDSLEMMRRHHSVFCKAGVDAKYANTGRKFELEQFESIWGEYTVISGETVTPHAAELIDLYPDAKIILTVRDDEERWLQSLLDTMWYNNTRWATSILRRLDPSMRDMRSYTDSYWKYMFWNNPQDHGIRAYREHNALVKRKTPPERLLIYNVKEGWEPLCRFLQKDVPTVPFPHRNLTQDHRRMFGNFRRQALRSVLLKMAKRVGVIALIFSLVVWIRARSGLT